MGQIETKNEDNANNKVDDKEIDEKKASNDVKIQMQNNSDEKENKDLGLKYEEIEKEDENKNANACDFGCTIFYLMVAMLLFTTMSRTYSSYSGGSCLTFAAQPFLAYFCIGFACVLIRRLRKQIKEQIRPLTFKFEIEPKTDSEDNELFKAPLSPEPKDESKPVDSQQIIIETNPKTENPVPDALLTKLTDASVQNSDSSAPPKSKSSVLLPLPLLPPPYFKRRSTQALNRNEEINVLSAVDLNLMDTAVVPDMRPNIGSNISHGNSVINNNSIEYNLNKYLMNSTEFSNNISTLSDNHDLNDKKY